MPWLNLYSTVSRDKVYTGYVLELGDGCYYVGISIDLNTRLLQHINNSSHSSKWVKRHKFKSVLKLEFIGKSATDKIAKEWERTNTLEMMKKYGYDKVRGHCWTSSKPLKVCIPKGIPRIVSQNTENEDPLPHTSLS